MPILEDCSESLEATFTVSYRKPSKVIIEYPTDGTEDEFGFRVGWTRDEIEDAVSGEVETLNAHGVTAISGTAISLCNYRNQDGELLNLCNQPISWVYLSNQLTEDEQLGIGKVGNGKYGISFDGKVYRPGYFFVLNPGTEIKADEDYLRDKVITKPNSQMTFIDGVPPEESATGDCLTVTYPSDNFTIKGRSMQIGEIKRPSPFTYYQTSWVDDRGWKYIVSIRTTEPTSIISIPQEDVVYGTYEATKQSDEQFYVSYGRNNGFYLYATKLVGSRRTYRFITKFDNPFPEYETIFDIACGSTSCPEGTCEVTCGDTICCYNSQGISVANFPAS